MKGLKRATQVVTDLAIAAWVLGFVTVQIAIWNTTAQDRWVAESIVFSGLAIVFSLLAWIGWKVLPPPD